MRIVHLSYAHIPDYDDPYVWLQRIDFFIPLLEHMAITHEVISIHCINYTGSIKRNNVTYHFMKRSRWQLFFPEGLHQYVKNLNGDVVIVHGIHLPLQVLLLHKMLPRRVAIVIQHHAEKPPGHYKAILQRRVDRYVSAYLFASADQARPWVKEHFISGMDKVHEVMEVPSVFYPVDKHTARDRTNVVGEFVYLWVGRLDENKDPVTLLNAFIQFARLNANVKLYLIYHGIDSEERIEKMLDDAQDVRQQIALIKKVAHQDLLYWFNSADFIISTSHYEGMGIAVVEGMSCGCIPILTNIPSFRSVTGSGHIGILFQAGDDKSLLDALGKSLTIDIPMTRGRVLTQYTNKLSAQAIAEKMIEVCEHATRKLQDAN